MGNPFEKMPGKKQEMRNCPDCRGSGKTSNGDKCSRCSGSGKVKDGSSGMSGIPKMIVR